MAMYTAKLSVQDAAFPLLSRNAGRSTLVPSLDVNPTDETTPMGLAGNASSVFNAVAKPHIAYCENVIPRDAGFSSIGYNKVVNGIAVATQAQGSYSLNIRNMSDALLRQEPAALVFFQASPNVSCATTNLANTVVMPTANSLLSLGNAGGIQFVLNAIAGGAVNLFEARINVVGTAVELASLASSSTNNAPLGMANADFAEVNYCCGAGNYFILAKPDGTIYWSAPTFVTYIEPTVASSTPWSFSVGAQVTGVTSGATGLISAMDTDGLGLGITGVIGTFAAGERLTTTVNLLNVSRVVGAFQAGETIYGRNSNATGRFSSLSSSAIYYGGATLATFVVGETVYGSRSGATATVESLATAVKAAQIINTVNNAVPNFSPSLITGAGLEIPSAMSGTVIGLQQFGNGFIVHTTVGDISATYSNNAQLPWIFAPIWNSAPANISPINGMVSSTSGSTRAQLISWTSSGLMEVTSGTNSATGYFPEVSDFLAGRLIEKLDINGLPTTTDILLNTSIQPQSATSDSMQVSLAYVGSRYLCISYGAYTYSGTTVNSVYTQCLVYDIALKRWGKLVFNHVAVIRLPTVVDQIAPSTKVPLGNTLDNIGLVDVTGAIWVASTQKTIVSNLNGGIIQTVNHAGVLIMGGVSFTRDNYCNVNSVKANFGQVQNSSDLNVEAMNVYWSPSVDNINFSGFTQLAAQSTGVGSATWGMRGGSMYNAFKFTGYFHISEVEVKIYKGGNR